MKTTVIYHRADYDGLFSAAVCQKFLPEADMIGWDFGDPLIPFPSEGHVFIVDLPPDCVGETAIGIGKLASRIVWIDHHKSSIQKWDELGVVLPGYRIDGVAACRLCWQYFTQPPNANSPLLDDYKNRDVVEPLAITLAGEYDVWDKSDPRAEAFQFGLLAEGLDDYESLLSTFLWDSVAMRERPVNETVTSGEAAMRWQSTYAAIVCKERSYVRDWEGRTFCILGSPHARNSMWFPQESIPKGCDALMCWRYDGKQVIFSLYHAPGHEEHDLSTIAVKYGGGGHKGACGFSMPLDRALEVIR